MCLRLALPFVLIALPSSAQAQTVQLPTFQQFGVSTTVVVPDRGATSLGGVGRAAQGSNQFGFPGVPGNRSSAAAASASRSSVSVQIHDFEAMDRALLDQAAAMRTSTNSPIASHPRSARLPGRTAEAFSSLKEIRRARQKSPPAESNSAELMARADAARAAGNLGSARVLYQMAARRASGPLRDAALANYHALASRK